MNRTTAPDIKQADKLNLVLPEEITLQNDVKLYWLKDVKDDSVKVEISWDAGSKYQTKPLIAGFTNKLLLSGSPKKTAKAISEELDYYGGYIQKELDKDHAGVSIYGLNENIQDIFSVFQQALADVSFEMEEVEKEVRIAKNKFSVDSQKVKTLCRRQFNASVFGADTAYGRVAKIEDFDRVMLEDIRDFYDRFYYQTPVIFLTGNVSDEFIEMLRTWSVNFRQPKVNFQQEEFFPTVGRVDVPKKDALQSAIRIGRLMFDKKHEDYFHFQLLNTIFGGYFGSRLMANIREDKGYTYGIGSGLASMMDTAYFFITTEVGKDVKELAIREIFHEIKVLQTELIPVDELEKVKNYMLGEFLRNADGPLSMMEVFKNLYYHELPETYYSDFMQAIHDATAEDLRDLAIRYLQRDRMVEVVAG